MAVLPSYIKFPSDPSTGLNEILASFQPDLVALIVDENTEEHCLPQLNLDVDPIVLRIPSGEAHKTITTCQSLWVGMTAHNLSRSSLVVTLGGGVIGDLGGFVAATYKRGVRFVNVPTTLLSQVDASIGGKLGIDFDGLKNHVGVFKEPDAVLLCPGFLRTLPERQLISGFAEVLKHGLIWDAKYWASIQSFGTTGFDNWEHMLRRSVEIKSEIVEKDPLESGLRKILNFGHTLGHAVETWHLENGLDLLHGEAVAAGMIMESFLSMETNGLGNQEMDYIVEVVSRHFAKIERFPDMPELMSLLSQDKKNTGEEINFSLLQSLGRCDYNRRVSEIQIRKSVEYYQSL